MNSIPDRILRADWGWTGDAPERIERIEIWIEKGAIIWAGRQHERPHPPGCEVVDLSGHWLLPGLIDSHMHLFGVDLADPTALINWPLPYRAVFATADLSRLLEAGITAVRCMGSPIGPFLARAVRDGIVPGPHILAAGQWICPRGGTWDRLGWPQDWIESWGMFADGVDEVRQRVRERAREGAGLIKIAGSSGEYADNHHPWGDDPYKSLLCYSDEEMQAAVAEAHKNGLKIGSHCIGDAAVRQAVLAGVDTIEHGHAISDDTYRLLADHGTTVVPTLAFPATRARFGAAHGLSEKVVGNWSRHLAVQFESLRRAMHFGVTIGCGSDFIGPPLTPHGQNAYELELLVEGGMTPEQALTAAIVVGRRIMGRETEIGALAAGRSADIIAVAGNPLENISILRDVRFVMKGGHVYVNKAKAASAASRGR